MLPGSREVQASGPVKEDTVIGPKIAAVERRKARLPVTRQAGAFAKVPQFDLRHFGAPPPSGRQRRPGDSPEQRQGGLAIRRHAPRGAESARVHSTQDGDDDTKAFGSKFALSCAG